MFGVDDALLVMGGTQLAGGIMNANAAKGAGGIKPPPRAPASTSSAGSSV
jgi:hypothetical protein